MTECIHNQRCRYTHGYYCEDCGTFFPKDSEVYKQTELPWDLSMALHNIDAERQQAEYGDGPMIGVPECRELADRVRNARGRMTDELIAECEAMLAKYGRNRDSAAFEIGGADNGE